MDIISAQSIGGISSRKYKIRSGYAHPWHGDPPDSVQFLADGYLPNLPGHIAEIGLTPEAYLLDEFLFETKVDDWEIKGYSEKQHRTDIPESGVVIVVTTPTYTVFQETDMQSIKNIAAHQESIDHFIACIERDIRQAE